MAVQFAARRTSLHQDRFDYYWNQQGEWVEIVMAVGSGVQRVVWRRDGQLLYANARPDTLS